MSALSQARDSIKAELAHAMQGIDFYQTRIEALERALEDLDRIPDLESKQTGSQAKGRRGRSTGIAKKAAPHRQAGAAKQSRRGGAQSSGLPSTGIPFWMDLLSAEPKTAPEILQAALHKIGTPVSPEDRKKLAQRMVTAFHGMVKSGKVKDSGKGRERRFYRD